MDRHITVHGSGESAALPDRCNIDFRVWATAPTVTEATTQPVTVGVRVTFSLA
jgi:uncharacterized protein YggE